ncbi:hypothetical protein ASZ90_018583 [hydrocarbon metagenome]|uniref:Uncharacterized protein n=1 Tax=hydrocarbon metagenome TaxID=938273 RepID=A0A0W8E6I2_9ZZZZ
MVDRPLGVQGDITAAHGEGCSWCICSSTSISNGVPTSKSVTFLGHGTLI